MDLYVKRLLSLLIYTITVIFLTACGAEGPSKDILRDHMAGRITLPWELISFDIQDSVELGEGTGQYRNEFQAELKPTENLYTYKGNLSNIRLIELKVLAGEKYWLKGYIDSTPAPGESSWSHVVTVHYELQEMRYLPKNNFAGALVFESPEHQKLIKDKKMADKARQEELSNLEIERQKALMLAQAEKKSHEKSLIGHYSIIRPKYF